MFWKLLAESVLIQGALALIFAGTISYMYIIGKDVPDSLVQLLMLIIGFYFGARTQLAATRRAGSKGGIRRLSE